MRDMGIDELALLGCAVGCDRPNYNLDETFFAHFEFPYLMIRKRRQYSSSLLLTRSLPLPSIFDDCRPLRSAVSGTDLPAFESRFADREQSFLPALAKARRAGSLSSRVGARRKRKGSSLRGQFQ
jgi:hypothetical protein